MCLCQDWLDKIILYQLLRFRFARYYHANIYFKLTIWLVCLKWNLLMPPFFRQSNTYFWKNNQWMFSKSYFHGIEINFFLHLNKTYNLKNKSALSLLQLGQFVTWKPFFPGSNIWKINLFAKELSSETEQAWKLKSLFRAFLFLRFFLSTLSNERCHDERLYMN